MENQPVENHGLGSFWCVCTFGPCLQGQTRIAKLKSAYNSLIMVLEVWDGKQTYRKSLAGTLLVWSNSTLDPSCKVKQG